MKRLMILCSCFALLFSLGGCTPTKDSTPKEPVQPVPTITNTDTSNIPSIRSFKTGNLQEFLDNSYKLPTYPDQEHVPFQPAILSHNGYLYGCAHNKDDHGNFQVVYTDVNRQNATGNDYHLIASIPRGNSTACISFLAVSDENTVFYDQGAMELWLYDVAKDTCTMIASYETDTEVSSAQLKDGMLYFSTKDERGQNCFQYDITNKIVSNILQTNEYAPRFMNGTTYFISQNNENSSIGVYRQTANQREELLIKSSKEGSIPSLFIDDAYLYIPYQMEKEVVLYRYDLEKNSFEAYATFDALKMIQLQYPYLSWTNDNGQYFLLDLINNINYEYTNGPVFITQRGFVWLEDQHTANGIIDPSQMQLWYAVKS